MFGHKLITGFIVAATITGGVMVVGAQQGGPPVGALDDSAIGAALAAAASETGVDSSEILSQLVGGTSLAEVVTADGGDVQVVIDAAVTAMTERVNQAVSDGLLTQTRADRLLANLEEAVTEAVNGEWMPGFMGGFGGRPGRNGQGPMNNGNQGGMNGNGGGWGRGGRFDGNMMGFLGGHGPFMGGLLEGLDIDLQALHDALESGSTVAEAITDAGGDPAAALETALAGVEERLTLAVENGRLTQTEADTLQAQAELHLNEMLNASPWETQIHMQIIPNALNCASRSPVVRRWPTF